MRIKVKAALLYEKWIEFQSVNESGSELEALTLLDERKKLPGFNAEKDVLQRVYPAFSKSYQRMRRRPF